MEKEQKTLKYHPPVLIKYGKISLHTNVKTSGVDDGNGGKIKLPNNILLGPDPLDPTSSESEFVP